MFLEAHGLFVILLLVVIVIVLLLVVLIEPLFLILRLFIVFRRGFSLRFLLRGGLEIELGLVAVLRLGRGG